VPGPSVSLFVEGLLALKHPVAKPAGVAGERHPGLDRAHPAAAQLAIALPKGLAVLGEPPGDRHQRVASLARRLARDRPRLADRRRLIARWRQAGRRVEPLGGREALDRQRVDRERGRPGVGDAGQRRQDLAWARSQEDLDLRLDGLDVGLKRLEALEVAP
jgi:hypothetical protein